MFLKKRWLPVLWFYYGIRFSRSNLSESLLSPVQRRIRELSYPDESEMGIFFALAIPLDDPISTKAISVAFFFEANYQLTNSPVGNNENNQSEESSRRKKKSIGTNKRGIDRRTIYFILESKFESLGFPGKACLLRSICETCRNPLHYHNGLLGDLLRILFTPSSSLDENLPHEYRNAENQLDAPHNCSVTYSLCPFNIYDYITTSLLHQDPKALDRILRVYRAMKMFIIILITFATIRHFVGDSFASEDYDIRNLLRKKRWLLFPNPLQSETKLQVLFGLGLPMESEVSMTLGYVLKCNYRLPYKAADINDDPYVRHARATKRDNVSESLLPSSRKIATLSRWGLYRILEIAMETQGSDGRACLLRAICESAETPFWSGYNDLLGEILRVVLTPSTTHGEYEMYSNREYHAAEVIGKDSDGETCKMAYPECTYSPLDYFTRKSYF